MLNKKFLYFKTSFLFSHWENKSNAFLLDLIAEIYYDIHVGIFCCEIHIFDFLPHSKVSFARMQCSPIKSKLRET